MIDSSEINEKIKTFKNMMYGLSNTVSKLENAKTNLNNVNNKVDNNYKVNDSPASNNFVSNTINEIQDTISYINGKVIPNLRYEISKLEKGLM